MTGWSAERARTRELGEILGTPIDGDLPGGDAPQGPARSITFRRFDGEVLEIGLVGAPLLLWCIVAVGSGADAYAVLQGFFGSWPGQLLMAASLLALFYHLFNGIRHLVWDSGRALDIRTAYTAGWLVLIATVLATAAMLGRLV